MAKLSGFRINASAVERGEWVKVGNGDLEFEIQTRGYHPRYRDALNTLKRDAARRANRGLQVGQIPYTPDSLPPTMDDACQGRALAEHCIIDVRGLTHDDDSPVTADQFREMIQDREQYLILLILAINAAGSVGAVRAEETEAAIKNSAPASAGA